MNFYHYANIDRLDFKLSQVYAMHEVIHQLWLLLPEPQSKRDLAVRGACLTVKEHVSSQVSLVNHHPISAMALFRVAYENTLKAIWMHQGASDEWIEKFMSLPEEPSVNHVETAKPPSIKELLDSISQNHPSHIHTPLQEIYDKTNKAMHSFVHGGFYSVTHALISIPEQQRINLILNSNNLLLLASNLVFMPFGGTGGKLLEIQKKFKNCFPPFN